MQPTIGRVVIFTDFSDAFKARNNGSNQAPATVVRVGTQNVVNLKVHVDGEHDEWRTSVHLQGSPDSVLTFWNWPEIKK